MEQLLSMVGAALVLLSFAGIQIGRMSAKSILYQALNFVGAVFLAASAGMGHNWGFLVLNVVWAAFALTRLFKPHPPEAVI